MQVLIDVPLEAIPPLDLLLIKLVKDFYQNAGEYAKAHSQYLQPSDIERGKANQISVARGAEAAKAYLAEQRAQRLAAYPKRLHPPSRASLIRHLVLIGLAHPEEVAEHFQLTPPPLPAPRKLSWDSPDCVLPKKERKKLARRKQRANGTEHAPPRTSEVPPLAS